MLGSVATALLLAASASRVAAGPLDNHHRQIARGYAKDAGILEDYTPYHVRYLALDCQDKHNTPFFEKCCHPLLRWQKLSDRPKECIPSPAASSSAALAEPTAAPIDEDPVDECEPEADPEDCDDETTTTAPASTHIAVTTSSKAPEPTTYTHSEEPTTTKAEPEPTTTKPATTSRMVTSTVRPTTTAAPDNNGGTLINGGQATWFKQGGVAGACGEKHSDDDFVVAMDYRMYGDENSVSKYCGKHVIITNKNNGKTAKALIGDCCPTCRDSKSLDLSLGLFQALGQTLNDGVFPIEYSIVN